MENVTKQG